MKTAIEIVGKELRVHTDNNDERLSEDYRRGFTDGILHIHNLLLDAHSVFQQTVSSDAQSCGCCDFELKWSEGKYCSNCGRQIRNA